MTFLEAQQTARRLFGNTKLHRGKNRCFVLRDGMVIGDGRSWLEALRSAGELQMAKNAMTEAEQKHVHDLIAAFRTANPDVPLEGLMSKGQEERFDAFSEAYEKEHPSPVNRPAKKSSPIPEIPRTASKPEVQKPLVTLK